MSSQDKQHMVFSEPAGLMQENMPVQGLKQLSIDAVQPYMLPWDARKLLRCLNGLLAPQQASFGHFEPSLFCPSRAPTPLPEGQLLGRQQHLSRVLSRPANWFSSRRSITCILSLRSMLGFVSYASVGSAVVSLLLSHHCCYAIIAVLPMQSQSLSHQKYTATHIMAYKCLLGYNTA